MPGAAPPPEDPFGIAALTAEMDHLLYILGDLRLVWYHFPMNTLVPLHQRYSARYAELYAEFQRRQGVVPDPSVATEPPPPLAPGMVAAAPLAVPDPAPAGLVIPDPPPGTAAAAPPTTPPEPWVREFLTDHAILLLAYMGALALIAATILFEVYTAGEIGGGVRFAVVLAVTIAFGAGGMICLDRPKLHIIGRSYLFVFALMAPLAGAAAYRFLHLADAGIEPHTAVAVGAGYSAVLYALMARRVGSPAYALLALLCVPFCAAAASSGVVPAAALGAVVGAFGATFASIEALAPLRTSTTLFATPGRQASGIVIAAALLTAVVTIPPGSTTQPELTLTIAESLAAFSLAALTFQRRSDAWFVQACALAGVMSLATTIQAGHAATAAMLLTLAAVNTAAAAFLPRVWRALALTGFAASLFIAAAYPLDGTGQTLVMAAIVVLVAAVAHLLRDARAMGLAAVTVLLQLAVTGTPVAGTGTPLLPYLAISAWLGALALASLAWRDRRGPTVAGAAITAAGGALLTCYTFAAADAVYATVLTALAAASAAATPLTPPRWRAALAAGTGSGVCAAATIPLAGLEQIAVIAGAVVIVAVLAHLAGDARLMGIAAASPVLQYAATGNPAFAATPPLLPYLAISTWLGALTLVTLAWRDRRDETMTAASVTGVAAALLTCYTWAAAADIYELVLVNIAAAHALAGHLVRRPRLSYACSFVAVATGLLATPMIAPSAGVEALLMAVVAVVLAATAVDRGTPQMLVLAGGVAGWAWYWMGKAVFTVPHAGAGTLAELYIPLAVIWAAAAIGLRVGAADVARLWAPPVEFVAAAVGTWALILAVFGGDTALSGWILVAGSGVAYLDGRCAGRPRIVWSSAAALGLGVLALLNAAAAEAAVYPLALGVAASAIYAVGAAGAAASPWARLHREAGLAGATLVATAALGVPGFRVAGNSGALTSLVVMLIVAAMLFSESQLDARPLLTHAAAAVVALSTTWISVYAGFTNPQAYVAIPGAAAIAIGLALRDHDGSPNIYDNARLLILSGATLMLGTSALQGLGTGTDSSWYIALLLAESLVWLTVSIGRRDRTLSAAAGAAVIVAVLEALGNIIQAIPLYVVFAAAAVLLLGGATALAASRQQMAQTRGQLREAWRTWR